MDTIIVRENDDSITVTDQDTQLPITITDVTVSVSQVDVPISVTSKQGDVIVVNDGSDTIEIKDNTEIIRPQFREVMTIVQQIVEEEMIYTEEVDFVGDDLVYRGWANPGSISSQPLWRVRRTRFVGADGDVIHDWANGNGEFTNIWDDRATFSYA
jgi:hypothetical protein